MNDIKRVVWDWNGTLLDDIDASMEALNTILKKAQPPLVLDEGEYRKYFQLPVIEHYKRVGFDFEKTPSPTLTKEYMRYYQPRSMTRSLHDGVTDVLSQLKKKGVHQYLLSASDLYFLYEQLDNYDIEQYFEQIRGPDNIHTASKAELAKRFVQENGLNPREVVFIGDSIHNGGVAHGAGCRCILITNRHEGKGKLEKIDYVVVDTIHQCESLMTWSEREAGGLQFSFYRTALLFVDLQPAMDAVHKAFL